MIVLYVLGAGRSGSTALGSYLARATGGLMIGEGLLFWERGATRNELCSCGMPVRECPFWSELLAAPSLVGLPADRIGDDLHRHFRASRTFARERLRLGPPQLREATASALLGLYETASRISGRDVIVDTSKNAHYAGALSALGVTTARLVSVRDPISVAKSWDAPKQRLEVHWRVEHMERIAPWKAYLYYASRYEYILRRHPEAPVVRQEEFKDAPTIVDARLEQLGLLPRERQPALEHAASGNPGRLGEGSRLPARPSTMTPHASRLERFTRARAVSVARRFGYS